MLSWLKFNVPFTFIVTILLKLQKLYFSNVIILQEMFATSTKAIHNRFDDLEKAIAKLNDRQQGTEKKLEELASKISGKAKVIQIKHPQFTFWLIALSRLVMWRKQIVKGLKKLQPTFILIIIIDSLICAMSLCHFAEVVTLPNLTELKLSGINSVMVTSILGLRGNKFLKIRKLKNNNLQCNNSKMSDRNALFSA